MQGPTNQRPDFDEAKHMQKTVWRIHRKNWWRKQTDPSLAQQIRQRHEQPFEGFDEYKYTVDPRTGWRFYPSSRPTPSSSSAHWDQNDYWKSNKSWDSWQTSSWTEQFFLTFSCLAIDGVCRQIHLPHATFSHAQSLHRLLASVYSHITHTRGSRLEYIFLSHIKHFILCAPCPIPCSTHARALLLRLFSVRRSEEHCHDPRLIQRGTSAESPRNRIVDDQFSEALHRRRSDHWTRGSCQAFVLQPVGSTFNLWLSGKHRDATGIGLRWRTNSYYAGFTTVFTGARGKCETITSLSLRTRRLDVRFISRSDNRRYRETCPSVFKSE